MKTKNDSSTKRQYISIFICWFSYVVIYLARYTYSANIALFERDYNVTHATAGLVMTFFSAAYGFGQVIHGLFCRKYPKRIIVSAALIVSAIVDLFIFFGIPFYMIKYLWLVNALCQSLLWPTLMQIISENVSDKHLKTAILVMSTTTSLGTLFTYALCAALSGINYRLTFLIGSFIILIASVVWFVLYQPGHYLKPPQSDEKNGKQNKVPFILILPIALLLIFSIVTNFVKDGLQTWVPVILKSIKPDLSDGFSIALTLILPIFGVFGATLAVLLNKTIKKIIPLTLFLFSFVALFNFIVFKFQHNLIITIGAFGILELLLHGAANVIVSLFPLSMKNRMSSGALTGILNGCGYIGTASSSYLLGKIADISGWSAVFATLLGTVCSVLILGLIYFGISLKKPQIGV